MEILSTAKRASVELDWVDKLRCHLQLLGWLTPEGEMDERLFSYCREGFKAHGHDDDYFAMLLSQDEPHRWWWQLSQKLPDEYLYSLYLQLDSLVAYQSKSKPVQTMLGIRDCMEAEIKKIQFRAIQPGDLVSHQEAWHKVQRVGLDHVVLLGLRRPVKLTEIQARRS